MRFWCIALPLLSVLSFGVSTVHAAPTVTVPEPIQPPGDGNPIVQSPPSASSQNVTVNITPPPPDPQATQAMMDYFVANTEYNHGNVPVTIATDMLKGANIFTSTPWQYITLDTANKLQKVARNVTLALFLIGIIWVGTQIAFGQLTSTTNYQMLLPVMFIGFLLAFNSDLIAQRSVDLNNWLCAQFGSPDFNSFTGSSLTLPDQPKLPDSKGPEVPGIIGVPASFFSGLITSVLYAIVLIVLEMKMIFRDAVLVVCRVLMPVSGALWAFSITRHWGVMFYRLFFGWLFGQPIVVVCLSIASSLLTLFNQIDGPAQTFVKIAVLFMAIKGVTLLVGGGLGSGNFFGLAGLMLLMRRSMASARGRASTAVETVRENAAAVQSGQFRGTGDGTAATGRPWRPAYGSA